MIRQMFLLAGAIGPMSIGALAADLPSRNPPPVYVPPVFTWTGAYVGGQVGYQWAPSSGQAYSSVTGTFSSLLPSYNNQGVIGGAHIGYNWQVSQFVFGLEGDAEGSSYKGSVGGPFNFSSNVDVEGSIRGRAGIAWDRALFYATGGIAFAPIRDTYTNTVTGRFDNFSSSRVGWTIGGGLEYAIDYNWSVRAEYRYTDFATYNDVLVNSSASLLGVRKRETTNAARVGFSYKFDMYAPARPVVAKY